MCVVTKYLVNVMHAFVSSVFSCFGVFRNLRVGMVSKNYESQILYLLVGGIYFAIVVNILAVSHQNKCQQVMQNDRELPTKCIRRG